MVKFMLDNKVVEIDFEKDNISPTTTVLKYLRKTPEHKGVKEGCGEGDCGACTVVIADYDSHSKLHYKAYTSCLIFLPSIHGKQIITVEGVGSSDNMHPVQSALVETDGSQCGYCTPGFTMSMFALYKEYQKPSKDVILDALTGNLCRCTGYRPIIEAAEKSCVRNGKDHFSDNENATVETLKKIRKEIPSVKIETKKQKYFLPATVKEALELKMKYPKAIIINGGTDVALRVTKKKELLSEIIDLTGILELKYAKDEQNQMVFGSGICLEDVRVIVKNEFSALYDMLSIFGSKQVRNRATFGGSLGSASPIGDTAPVLMAYDAILVLESLQGTREIQSREFVTGYRQTQMKENELIVAVKIPKIDKSEIVKSYKISKRKDLDISTVSSGFRLKKSAKNIVEEICLVYGGMAATTSRSKQAEAFLLGKEWTRENIEKAMKLVDEDFTPISDARSGAEARKIMARNLLLKFYNDSICN
ncbi:MAG: xanthine dehydrogenase small subunit [Bacteroidetes bacterium GWF2_33_38]|nr:MAG: xanthine dehydrogenase small subunit [Bacteroidetes bacterium GWF2_33_38]